MRTGTSSLSDDGYGGVSAAEEVSLPHIVVVSDDPIPPAIPQMPGGKRYAGAAHQTQQDKPEWWYVWYLLPRHGSILFDVLPYLGVSLVSSILATVCYLLWEFSVPSLGHVLLGTALSFLLVFRSNLSYGRYMEGRAQVGVISKDLRNIARHAAFFVGSARGGAGSAQMHTQSARRLESSRRLVRYAKLFISLLVVHLRKETELPPHVTLLLSEEEERHLREFSPTYSPFPLIGWMASEMALLYADGLVSNHAYVHMDSNLADLSGSLSSCNKVQDMKLPFAYAQMLLLLLYAWGFTLPWVLVGTFEEFTVIPAILISFAFFGINSVGIQLEDPFGTDANDLPMERYENATHRQIQLLFAHAIHRATPAIIADESDEDEREAARDALRQTLIRPTDTVSDLDSASLAHDTNLAPPATHADDESEFSSFEHTTQLPGINVDTLAPFGDIHEERKLSRVDVDGEVRFVPSRLLKQIRLRRQSASHSHSDDHSLEQSASTHGLVLSASGSGLVGGEQGAPDGGGGDSGRRRRRRRPKGE